MDDLLTLLEDYKMRINGNSRALKLIQSWTPCLVIRELEERREWGVVFDGTQVKEILTDTSSLERDRGIVLEASKEEFVEIFTGRKSPADSFLEGQLTVNASEKDQIKLDALSVVLWEL